MSNVSFTLPDVINFVALIGFVELHFHGVISLIHIHIRVYAQEDKNYINLRLCHAQDSCRDQI